MKYYAGVDVSLESASICVVDERGLIVREDKVASEPAALIGWLGKQAAKVALIGLEAGPLSQWLHGGLSQAGLTVELLETRHVRAAFKAMSVKTDTVLSILFTKNTLAPPDTPIRAARKRNDRISFSCNFSWKMHPR